MSEDCPFCIYNNSPRNCHGCFEGSNFRPKPITNADRIRSMDDDELTELLYAWHLSSFSKQKEWIHNWLKKKVQI